MSVGVRSVCSFSSVLRGGKKGFQPEFEVWHFHRQSILRSVESFRRHEFSKNSDFLQLAKEELFLALRITALQLRLREFRPPHAAVFLPIYIESNILVHDGLA